MRNGTHRFRYEFLPDSTSAQIVDSWVNIPDSDWTVCIPIYDVVFNRSITSTGTSSINVGVVSSRKAREALDLAKPANRNLGHFIVQIPSGGTATRRMLAGCYTVFGYKGTCPGTTTECKLSFADEPACVGGDDSSTNTVEVDSPDGVNPDNESPNCANAGPSIGTLWPPDHRLVPVDVLGVTDPDGNDVSITITGIFQDEAVNGLGDADTAPDGVGAGADMASLRAERAGGGNGRLYTIIFSAEDGRGGECAGQISVGVPKSQGRNGGPVDDGAVYDSTNL
jgi:hypothetical protein